MSGLIALVEVIGNRGAKCLALAKLTADESSIQDSQKLTPFIKRSPFWAQILPRPGLEQPNGCCFVPRRGFATK